MSTFKKKHRFGIFAAFVPLIPILSVPFSGILFQKLRYISKNSTCNARFVLLFLTLNISAELVLMCIPINIIGILYIIFVLKESKPADKSEPTEANGSRRASTIIENVQSDADHLHSYNMNGNRGRRSTVHVIKEKIEQNFFVQFFNPIVAIGCIRLIVKKREYNGRRILVLLLITYFLAVGPAFGEEPNEYNFTRIKLNWDGLTYSPFATYGNAVSLIGTIIMVGCFSKLCYMSDPLVGFLGTTSSAVSRILFVSHF